MSSTVRSLAIFGGFLIIALVLFRNHFSATYPVDDAYIYLSTVRNVIAGHGWGVNPGEIVNACSSTTYTLLLLAYAAIAQFFATDLSTALVSGAAVLQLLCLASMAMCIFVSLKNFAPATRLTFCLTLAFHPIFLFASGMESALFALMLVLSVAAYLANRWLLAGILLGLLTLTRPEGALLVPVLLLLVPPPHLRAWWLGVLGFVLPVSLWLLFSGWYFGSIVPNSTLAKLQQAGSLVQADSFFAQFFKFTGSVPLLLVICAAGVRPCLRTFLDGRPFLSIIVVYGFLQGVGYGLAGAKGGYFWYYVPAYLSLTVLFSFGILSVLSWLSRKLLNHRQEVLLRTHTLAIAGQVLLAVALVYALGVIKPLPRNEYRNAAQYIAISHWVQANTPPDFKLASPEIGYLGFYSDRFIVDPFGLIHHTTQGDASAAGILRFYQPEVLVLPAAWLSVKAREQLEAPMQELLSSYEPVRRFGSLQLLIKRGSNN